MTKATVNADSAFSTSASTTVSDKKVVNGREVWHVVSDGTSVVLTTTSTTAEVMDTATVIYAPALRRLALK